MSRIDLDAIEQRSRDALDPSPIDGELDDIEVEVRTYRSAQDVPALVNEARAGRLLDADVRQVRAKVATLLDRDATKPMHRQELRGILADLDTAVHAYTGAVGR